MLPLSSRASVQDHDRCSYCGLSLAAGAGFCPGCGEERAGYAEQLLRRDPPPPPGFDQRLHLQGAPVTRLLVALFLALAAAAASWYTDVADSTRLLLGDGLLALAVLATAWPMRRELRPLMRTGSWSWWGIATVTGLLLPGLGSAWGQWLDLSVEIDPFHGISSGVLLLSVVFLPAVFEEIAFRGVFLQCMSAMTRPRTAQWVTALSFAAVHLQPAIFPYHGLVGLWLGWLRVRSGSLWVPMLAHAVHNAAVLSLWP